MKSMISRFAMLLLCTLTVGCGFGTGDQPDLGTVTGTVYWEGAPLAGASVLFQPLDGRPATATTDKEGRYDLNYIREIRGTKVGLNKVEISTDIEGDDNEQELEGDDVDRKAIEKKKTKIRIPPKYNTRTELEVDVQPGENTFDFQLTQ